MTPWRVTLYSVLGMVATGTLTYRLAPVPQPRQLAVTAFVGPFVLASDAVDALGAAETQETSSESVLVPSARVPSVVQATRSANTRKAALESSVPPATGSVPKFQRVDGAAAVTDAAIGATIPTVAPPGPTLVAAPISVASAPADQLDAAAIRKAVEPRVLTGKASEGDIKLLIATCKRLHDTTCKERAIALLEKKQAAIGSRATTR